MEFLYLLLLNANIKMGVLAVTPEINNQVEAKSKVAIQSSQVPKQWVCSSRMCKEGSGGHPLSCAL